LCDNFQQQSCSVEPFPHVTVHRYWRQT